MRTRRVRSVVLNGGLQSLTLEAAQGIGLYSINRLKFDPDVKEIRVECNEALIVVLSASDLDVELIT